MRAAGTAAIVGVVYMACTAALYHHWQTIAGWAVVMLGVQGARQAIIRAFYAKNPQGDDLTFWGRAFVVHQAVAGLAWGSSIFLFADTDHPVSISLVLTGMFLLVAGAVPAQAYTPASFYAFNVGVTSLAFIRLAMTGQAPYILLGAISVVFGLAMTAFCKGQARLVREGFRIRFENEALLQEVTMQKAQADDARGRAEQALTKAEEASLAKSQFLAAASHDLRQPLYALSLFSTSLGALKLDEDGRAVVGQLQNSIGAMESLFVNLLDVSRLDAGVVKSDPTAMSVDVLFDRLSQYFRPIAIERGLDLRFRSNGEWVTSDLTLLEQVVSNLVSNALRYTHKGGVLVAARKREACVRVEIWDTGIGIDQGDRERIFREFVQLDNAQRDRQKGLGLGLSIAQRSAALIGGAITMSSRPGRGSCFAISQPLALDTGLGRDVGSEDRSSLRLLTSDTLPVLVVDDDRDVRAAIGDLLTRWHVSCDLSLDAADALGRIESGKRYGLVIADYRLPGNLNGLDLMAAIAQRHATPVPAFALVTADFDPDLLGAAAARGIALFHKPLKADRLRAMLGLVELA